MTATILTEEEKERLYDLERGLIADVTPARPALPAHMAALRAQIDAETDQDVRRRLILRLADQMLDAEEREIEAEEAAEAALHTRSKLADYVSTPESRAAYDTMSPEAQRLANKLIGVLDRMPDSEVDQAINQVLLALDDLAKLPVTLADEESDDNPLTEEEEAAYDAANQQKVYDRIKSAFESKSDAPMFIDTLPGRVNDVPIDLLVTMNIGAAMERNLTKLGITRDQLFRILETAVNPVVDEYLITPERRMRLIWDGME